jgi:hypothetical protein
MPSLIFPIDPDGLLVPVRIGLSEFAVADRTATGRAIPLPLLARGEIDTGANMTSVAGWIVQQLGLPPGVEVQTQTASGTVKTTVRTVGLTVTDAAPQPASPELSLPTWVVSELAVALPDADVLIGLDVVRTCKLIVDGPAQTFTLEF